MPTQMTRNHIRQYCVKTAAYLWRGGVDLLFPRRCMACHRCLSREEIQFWTVPRELPSPHGFSDLFGPLFSPFLCPGCMGKGLKPLLPPRCSRCAAVLRSGAGLALTPLCASCRVEDSAVDGVRAVGAYGHGLLTTIHLLKYKGRTALARPLGTLLFLAFSAHFHSRAVDVAVPVPLHRSRLKQRGFNQAFLLLDHLGKTWRRHRRAAPPWQVDYRVLKRRRKTASQTGFSREERRDNLKNAFCVTAPEKVKGKAVLLVDDVYTTGTTCGEAARVLKSAGAVSVHVLVLARA